MGVGIALPLDAGKGVGAAVAVWPPVANLVDIVNKVPPFPLVLHRPPVRQQRLGVVADQSLHLGRDLAHGGTGVLLLQVPRSR